MRYAVGVVGRVLLGLLAMAILSVAYFADVARARLQSAKNRNKRDSGDDSNKLARA